MTTHTDEAGLKLTHEDAHRALVDRIFETLRGRVEYADLCIEEVTKVELNRLVSGEELLKPYTQKGALQLRLVGEGGRRLELSVGLLPFEALEESLEYAVGALALQEPDPRFGLAEVPNPDRVRYGEPVGFDLRGGDVGPYMRALVDDLARLAEETVGDAPEAIRADLELESEIWCYYQVEEKLIADTNGLLKTQILPSTFLSVTAKCRNTKTGKATEQRGRIGDIKPLDYLFAPGGGTLSGEHRESMGGTFRRAVALQSGRRLEPDEIDGVTHFILDSTAMVFVHEAEGHNFEADLIRDGSSGLVRADGTPAREPLATPVVDIYDGPVRKRDGGFETRSGFGTHFIDDEGVEVEPVQLVKDGRIVGMLHSRETAHHYGARPNGRGFSELGDPRIPRMTNTYLYPADGAPWYDDVTDLFDGVGFGLYLEGSKGGAVSKDGMSTSIQYVRVIRDGKLTDEVLLPANLTVRTATALEGVEAYAGPLKCDDPGFCGKGQTKTVTDGGPVTRIRRTDAITIGW